MVENLHLRRNEHGYRAHRALEDSAAKNRSNRAHILFQSCPFSRPHNRSYRSLNLSGVSCPFGSSNVASRS